MVPVSLVRSYGNSDSLKFRWPSGKSIRLGSCRLGQLGLISSQVKPMT